MYSTGCDNYIDHYNMLISFANKILRQIRLALIAAYGSPHKIVHNDKNVFMAHDDGALYVLPVLSDHNFNTITEILDKDVVYNYLEIIDIFNEYIDKMSQLIKGYEHDRQITH